MGIATVYIYAEKKNKLLQYNASFDVFKELSECECKNLWCFVRHALLEVQLRRKYLRMAKSGDDLKLKYFLNLQSFTLHARYSWLKFQLWTILNKLLILKVLFSTLWKETK